MRMPTTASTATIRAWAQAEGLDVAERGRLRPDILDAFAAANESAAKKKTARAKASAATTPARSVVPKAPARTPARSGPKPAANTAPVALAEASAAEGVRVAVDVRIVDLQDALAALTARVSKLETAASAPSTKKRFGR